MKRKVIAWGLLCLLISACAWQAIDLFWWHPPGRAAQLQLLQDVVLAEQETASEEDEAALPAAFEQIMLQEEEQQSSPTATTPPGWGRVQVLGLLLALLGTPLFAVIGMMGLFLTTPDKAFFIDIIDKLTSSSLFITLPLFTFTGFILSESQAPQRLVRFSRALLGWLPGGTALMVVITCAFFTAFTGASGVTIIAMGGLLYPMLMREQYGENFSLGLLTTCGSLGLLFYPSLPLILYAVIATNAMQGLGGQEFKINELFIAGVVPGILLIIILALYGSFTGVRRKHTRQPLRGQDFWQATRAALPELLCPVILVGGYFGGYLQLTEAAAVIAGYTLLVEVGITRDIPWQRLPDVVRRSMALIGAIMVILMMAIGFTWVITYAQIPQHILAQMQRYIQSPVTFLLVLNIFLLVVGCLMDIFSAILVVVPLIIPIAHHYGVDPLHLGIIFLTNLEIGYSTPPVGMNLFIASLRFQKSILRLYVASLPFIGLLLGTLMLITFVPQLSLYCVHHPTALKYLVLTLILLLLLAGLISSRRLQKQQEV